MNESERERIAKLLKKSVPRVGDAVGPGRDLWPQMLRRLQEPAGLVVWFERAWFDGALLAAVVVWMAVFPAAIPVLLYHL